ncbi:PAS domain S-box protein [Rhizobium sp. L1K21]|uniref:PAS domain-containing sensor histidine kinase n=1 Tax=Rhizobium sp. L1K21 TaxID=2954933 RepID=UPI002091EAFC|nr:PAS domain S-box protein [Rhizobium sp. L1K21]MCO6187072.1 PAS domain S-box protein [Rhizobium sp. L1K21]
MAENLVQYPFIDIAVHERVRNHFARGEALVLFSADVDSVLWANGAGARLFGHMQIYDFLESGPDETDLTFRQMATTAKQLARVGDQKSFLMRVSSGFQRATVQASVEVIATGKNQTGVLFSAPVYANTARIDEIAGDMIFGIGDEQTHVAVLGEGGRILASSSNFYSLDLPEHVVSMLYDAVRGKPGHLVKRPILSSGKYIPAAIGAISNNPPLYLLFCLEPQEDTVAEDQGASEKENMATEMPEMREPSAETEEPPHMRVEPEEGGANERPSAPVSDFIFDPKGRTVRFVWKIGPDGRFQEVSSEFAKVLGPRATDIIGKSFTDITKWFGIDPDGRIAELLKRRDTWSGKTVFWPAENTSLKVPVDLAALPAYSRERAFDGFRGFGVVRVAGAVEDENAIGLNLSLADKTPAEAAETSATSVPEATEESWNPPHFEPPALKIEDTPRRRESDKVIDLEARRNRAEEALSASEKAAFEEIARQLGGKTPTIPDEPAKRMVDETGAPAPEKPRETSAPREGTRNPFFSPTGRSGLGLTADVVANLPVAMLAHSGDKLIYANPEFFKLTGYENLSALEANGGIDALLERDENANPDSSSMLMVTADGRMEPVNCKLQSIRWEGSSALLLSLAPLPVKAPEPEPVVDEEPKETAELRSLRAEVQELRSILETATDGVVTLSESGEIRSMNKSALALFNYSEAETVGKPFAMLFAHESQKSVADYLSGLAGHGVASLLNDGREVIGREASGGTVPLFMTMGKLSTANGYCAVIRDITQWKRTEDELRNAKHSAETASAHKTDFLASVSHEIRTPLNAIIGFAEMMANEGFGPIGHPRYIEYANDIGRSGRHVLDIVNDLLDISKIEAGQMDLEFGAVSLNETIAEAVSLVQPQANAQRVIIRTSLSQSVPEVVADTRSIKQIAINILANAIKFTSSGGQIVVSTVYQPNGSVLLRIRDTGSGMTREELEQAMKPFRQVSGRSARKRGDGTGLGLPLTKAMTEANRASFSISSTPNEGTLVEIAFPSQRVLAN